MEAFGKGELLEDGFKDLYIARKSSQIFVVYVKVNENFIVEKNIKVYKCDEGDTTLLQI